jgi:hypothetical protein
LQDDGVAVAIGNQARQAVGLAVNQPQTVLPMQFRQRLRRSTAA